MKDGKNSDIYLEMLNKIAEKAEETQNCVNQLDKKVDLHIQKTQYELEKINKLDEEQNRILDKHIEGVNTLKKMYSTHEEENNTRFEALEAPRKWLSTTMKIILTVGGVVGAILGVVKYFL